MRLAVVGGGPAGLFAAETAALAGAEVVVFEAKPTPARKLLVAGYGGLNLTHGEPLEDFIGRYRGPGLPEWFGGLIRGFPPAALRAWAEGLGVPTFEQRTGRVYPVAMKAAPLVRAWMARLRGLGVSIEKGGRVTDLACVASGVRLEWADGGEGVFDAVVLALGGASWRRTGSDGGWVPMLAAHGIRVHPFLPANCGWECGWPPELVPEIEGRPLKNIAASAGGRTVRGEIMLTRYGIEGGAVYQLGPELRAMTAPEIVIDLKPETSVEVLMRKMESVRSDFLVAAAERWKLSPQARALVGRFGRADTLGQCAASVKALRLGLSGLRPIDEAISSAGGVAWSEIDAGLMLRELPGVHVAGEMIDWEAPTGGYLIQACFATGRHAALAALQRCGG